MTRVRLLLAGLTAALAFTGSTAPAATLDCKANAAALAASATVTYRGADWGPTPLWTVDLRPGLNATIDVAANSADEARANALASLEQLMGCNTPPSTPEVLPPAPTPEAQAEATAAVTAATVVYVGADWGPVPLWRVTFPSGDSVDVAANSEAEARDVATAWLAAQLSPATPAVEPPAAEPEPVAAPLATSTAAVVSVASQDAFAAANASGLPSWEAALTARSAGLNALYGL